MVLPVGEAIEALANRLEHEQIKYGASGGSWPGEADFTGSIVAGMVTAYNCTCNNTYKSAAELSGDYIVRTAGGNFYGDEAFALTRLSQIASDPCDNLWRSVVVDFYAKVKHQAGTEVYTSQFGAADSSTAVFYLANHVVAAYYVNAKDKKIWRSALINFLAQVDDDSSNFPVTSLGVATWALATIGPLNDTLIDPSTTGVAYWSGKKLADLPALLLSHQVPDGELYAGSFYWRFDHGNGGLGGPVGGYTEDAIFATLGLISASRAHPALDLEAAILAARQALLGDVDNAGTVHQHLWLPSLAYCVYAGERLQVLGELIISGDLDLDGGVNFIDFAIFANNWHALESTLCCPRIGPAPNQRTATNYVDFAILASNWLKGFEPLNSTQADNYFALLSTRN